MARLQLYILVCATLCFVCPSGAFSAEAPKSLAFKLSSQEAIESRLHLPRSHLLEQAFSSGRLVASKKTWAIYLNSLTPAYQYRVSKHNSYEQYDVWLDATTGETLGIRPAFRRAVANAKVFNHSPNPRLPLSSQLVSAPLEDLLSAAEGAPLEGQFFTTANCCRYVKCPSGGRICSPSEWVCASQTDPSAQASVKSFRTQRSSVGLDEQNGVQDTIFLEASVCARLPLAHINIISGEQASVSADPIDDESQQAESDAFAEVQAYHSATAYFKYLRRLLNNPSFCFRSQAMSCLPDKNALHIFVNQMMPTLGAQVIRNQVSDGKGTQNNPVILTEMSRVTNAAYVTGFDSTASTFEPSLEETLGEFIKPYDYLIFFQGDVDMAYDGDVVFHEMTHALTTTLLPEMSINNLNEKGLYADMGAMDEGYADYFAASFTNSSPIGEYAAFGPSGRPALRDTDNLRVCPQDIIGEVHQDSNLWSGALWDIRKFVSLKLGEERIIELDRLYIKALASSSAAENFADQSQRILDLLAESPSLKAAYPVAEDAFFVRGLKSCERIFSLNEVMDDKTVVQNPKSALFLMSPENFGLLNYAPPPLQFKITLPQGVSHFQIKFEQSLSNDSLVNSGFSKNDTITPAAFLVSVGTPVTWDFKNGLAIPNVNGAAIQFDANLARAESNGDSWIFATQIPGDASTTRDVYVSILSTDYDYILHQIMVAFDDVQPTPQEGAGCACSAAQPKPFSLFEATLFLLCAVVFLASRVKQD